MNVELKNVEIHAGLSEETTAFTASVYLDGRRVGVVSNHGQGGSNFYDFPDREDMSRLREYAKAEIGYEYESEDVLIGNVLEEYELGREARKMRRKGADTVVLIQKGEYDIGDGTMLFADEYLIGIRGEGDELVAKIAGEESAEKWRVIA